MTDPRCVLATKWVGIITQIQIDLNNQIAAPDMMTLRAFSEITAIKGPETWLRCWTHSGLCAMWVIIHCGKAVLQISHMQNLNFKSSNAANSLTQPIGGPLFMSVVISYVLGLNKSIRIYGRPNVRVRGQEFAVDEINCRRVVSTNHDHKILTLGSFDPWIIQIIALSVQNWLFRV